MTASTVADAIKALSPATARGLRVLRRVAMRPVGFFFGLAANRAPERLLVAPQDVRTADPTTAQDIYAGYYALAGKIVNVHDRSPFEVESPSEAWAEALAGFGWLRHLRAADTALARANARALVEDWIAVCGRKRRGPSWRPKTTARRLLAWLSQAPLILDGADAAFYRQFMRALGWHAARLEQDIREGLDGRSRLLALIALAEFAMCAAGIDSLRRRATYLLEEELSRQILADGGHITRNPQALIDLLLDLLPLRQIYATGGGEPPERLFNSIDRMSPMLRLFRHADGDLALFNGMGATHPEDLATILAYDDVRAKPVLNAPRSGYQRIEGGGCVLVADSGKPPAIAFSREAHAGALAFEMSSSGRRVVVNCGAANGARADLREAARATAAHSTLIVADVSSSRFADHTRFGRWLPGRILSGPTRVEARRTEEPLSTMLELSHDGYEKRFGLIHRRRLRLFKEIGRLEGMDALEAGALKQAPTNLAYAIRFHLHPSAQAVASADGKAIEIRLPDGQTWLFLSADAPAELEESIFFASPHGSRASRQIVMRRTLAEARSLSWSFERLQATP